MYDFITYKYSPEEIRTIAKSKFFASEWDRKIAEGIANNEKPSFVISFAFESANEAKSRGSDEDDADALLATGAVEFAEPDQDVMPSFVPNDPYYSTQWHHIDINSATAWDKTRGLATLLVATCDTGVDATHPDLSDR